jgi:hypothetical protein
MEEMRGSRGFAGWSVVEFTSKICYVLSQALVMGGLSTYTGSSK